MKCPSRRDKAAWAEYMREYYRTHPEYAAKVRAIAKARHRRLMDDPEWRERERARCRAKERAARGRRKVQDPTKRHARSLLASAVRYGRVIKPTACGECGLAGRITAHHTDYSKPLHVVWLCTRCHGIRHRSEAA